MKKVLGFSERGRGALITSLVLASLSSAFSQSLDPIFSAQSGNWSEAATWSVSELPNADHEVMIGGATHTVTVGSLLSGQVGKVIIGHDLGINSGDGVLSILRGELDIASDLVINASTENGRHGTLNVERGILNIQGDLIYGASGTGEGTVYIYGVSGVQGDTRLTASNIIKSTGMSAAARLHLDGGNLDVSGDFFRNAGPSDEIRITGGELRFTDPARPGVMDAPIVEVLEWTSGPIRNLGTFDGDLAQKGGLLAPGLGPGTTTITGDYTMDQASALEISLHWNGVGIPSPGTDYDQIVVGGEFDAGGGYLDVYGQTGAVGSKFIIVTGSSPPIGQFVQGTEFRADNYVEYAIDYGGASGNDIELTFLGHYLDRDYDGDGLNNFHEIAFGTDINDPSDAHEGIPKLSVSGNVATIRFLQMEFPAVARTFVGYEMQVSTDNSTWTSDSPSYALSSDQSGAPPQYVFWETGFPVVTGERKFYRIVAFGD